MFRFTTAAALAGCVATASASVTVFEQGPNGLGANTVASDPNDPAMFTQADNFTLLEPINLERITFTGSYQFVTALRPDSFTISIHEDDGGLPAAVPLFETSSATIVRTPTGQGTVSDYVADLAFPVALDAGNYWLAIQNATADPGSATGRWGWARVDNVGPRARIFGSNSPDWEPISNGNLVFSLCATEDQLVHFWDFEDDGGEDHAGGGDGVVGDAASFAGPDNTPSDLFALGDSLVGGVPTTLESGITVANGDYYQLGAGSFTISFAYKRGIGDSPANDIDLLVDALGPAEGGGLSGWQVFTVGDTMRFRSDRLEGGVLQLGSGAVGFDPSGEEWRHFAVRCDRTGVIGWYIDGEASEFQFDASLAGTMSSTGPLRIGYWQAEDGMTGMDGRLDRLRIYNYALSDEQIAALAREVGEPIDTCPTDFTNDGVTNAGDLAILLAGWGACP